MERSLRRSKRDRKIKPAIDEDPEANGSPVVKSESDTSTKPAFTPIIKLECGTVIKSEFTPEEKSELANEVKSEFVPEVKSEFAPVVQTEPAPVVQTEPAPVIKSEFNTTVKSDPDPVINSEKRKSIEVALPSKKQKIINTEGKNALMQLNEMKLALQYSVESVTGPSHLPEYVMSVEVENKKYFGKGKSKQAAKHAAAEAALSAILQLENLIVVKPALCEKVKAVPETDVIENKHHSLSKIEIKSNGSVNDMFSNVSDVPKKILKLLTEPKGKNPVSILNEYHPGLTYNLVKEGTAPNQHFHISVDVDGMIYKGTASNKRQAKIAAAQTALSKLYNECYNRYISSANFPESKLLGFSLILADEIESRVVKTFNEFMIGNPEYSKWKVIAGIAMTTDENMQCVKVISLGTGTKCVSGKKISMNGANLNDCHAEIISRRCLKDYFYSNLELHLQGKGDRSIFIKKENGGYSLKENIKFHLYISTAPCGDARFFCPYEEEYSEDVNTDAVNRNTAGVLRTKVESDEGTMPTKSTQIIQTSNGVLSGQQRLLTMSCSDKIASWNVLGVQGALLSHFIEPIYLESVILGGLFHPDHLRRALFGRIESVITELPIVYKLNHPNVCVTSNREQNFIANSPDFSVNWTRGMGKVEIVNACSGRTENGQTSRISKRSFFQRFLNLYGSISQLEKCVVKKPSLYSTFKNAARNYQECKRALTSAFVKSGAGHWVKKPVDQNDFDLEF